jgi:hypothetical protein
METKEDLVIIIKEWIKINAEINELKNKTKTKNQEKKMINEKLLGTMKQNAIDCFDITGGSLVFKKNKVKKPISSKLLLDVLKKYCKNDNNATEITQFILDNREVSIKETISYKIDKT